MKIKQIRVKNFRSLKGEGMEGLSDFVDYNLFIGENNAGKSNVIKIIPFLADIFGRLSKDLNGSFSPSINNSHSQIADLFFETETEIILSVTFSISDDEKLGMLSGFPSEPSDISNFHAELFNNTENKITVSFQITRKPDNNGLEFHLTDLVWSGTPLINIADKLIRRNDGKFEQSKFDEDCGHFSNNTGEFNYLHVIISKFNAFNTRLRIIKAVRKIGGTSQSDDGSTSSRLLGTLDIDGDRAMDIISTWRSPDDSVDVPYKKYRQINSFVSSLLSKRVELIVSQDKKNLSLNLLDDDKSIRSYKSWGTSVEELIVLMVDILSSPEESVIALEEPEIHIDPFMQRKLISFLKTNTKHQYFISSHSSVLINSFADETSAIFRVHKSGDFTEVEKANETLLHTVLDELGVKASDILQTNGVIWVEGPSDRIFINKWISLRDPNLKEGIDYSIMFYSGKLLSHLTVDITEAEIEEQTNDFIKLARLNRNMVVIIDSDKKDEKDSINATKERIRREITQNSDRAIVWITDGKEIENYIPTSMFEKVLGIKGMGDYTVIGKIDEKYNKVDGAKCLVKEMTGEFLKENFSLEKKVSELVERIKQWKD